MYLGIAPGYNNDHHDPSACIVDNGDILAFVEQERMSRNKHATGEFPIEAIEECLEIANVYITDINKIGVPRDYSNRKDNLWRNIRSGLRSKRLGTGKRIFDTTVIPIKDRVNYSNSQLRSEIRNNISTHLNVGESQIPPIKHINHHVAHAASAYYPSGFDHALVISVDNFGGNTSMGIYEGVSGVLNEISTIEYLNSLGRFYSDITEYLGFRRSNGEGKVMGLAPYGNENPEVENVLSNYFEYSQGSYNVERLTYRRRDDSIKKLEDDLGKPARYWKHEIDQFYKDVAFHAQKKLEDTMEKLVLDYLPDLNTKNVCLAGGVALNCKMNRKIRKINGVDDIFVQPVASDAGGAIGSAYELAISAGEEISEIDHVYYGSGFSEEEVIEELDRLKVPYSKPDELFNTVAERISDGELIGWFQGRMEAGPRALGNRSILADPRDEESRYRVNKYVKHREEWRPFAPSMLIEDAQRYLVGTISKSSHFMIDTHETTSKAKKEIPAVLHPVDGTTRPQVVTKEQNERYYNLLHTMKEKTGVGVVLNTSFNDSGEPIVRTPRQAVRDFFAMGMDTLVLNDIVISKSDLDLYMRAEEIQQSQTS